LATDVLGANWDDLDRGVVFFFFDLPTFGSPSFFSVAGEHTQGSGFGGEEIGYSSLSASSI